MTTRGGTNAVSVLGDAAVRHDGHVVPRVRTAARQALTGFDGGRFCTRHGCSAIALDGRPAARGPFGCPASCDRTSGPAIGIAPPPRYGGAGFPTRAKWPSTSFRISTTI